ncbi:hypothetical protein O6P43_023967 [Quillaja saponaria]|uniref:Uncharacterized protein n=1 Tax=Quillaja saponaria TaxID=32244 RepID=A0AAD7LIH3_QUISA|nr:hypothetical protein O6P43_023967 [Quillaja saponaria]
MNEKYGENPTSHPEFNEELWLKATGGVKKGGKIYGCRKDGSAKVLFGDRASTSGRSTSSTATSWREYEMAHEIDSLKNELSTTKSELTQKVDEMKNLVNLLVAKLGVDTSILMPSSSGNVGASSSSRHGGEVDLGQDDAVNNEDLR